jgi:hypothetical protein
MLQYSKIVVSRNEWRKKAILRATELRDANKAKKRHQKKITKLKQRNRELERLANKKKVTDSAQSSLSTSQNNEDETRILCILLTIQAVVSYRSIPRILEIFKQKTSYVSTWIPHFTSIINWNLRLGLGRLKQVGECLKPWVAIIDHSIDIGTKKVLIVLRVPLDTLMKRESALRFEDCECIGLRVSEKVTGETIFVELEAIFNQAGAPATIIKDADRTLNKGVRLWNETQEYTVPVIDDLGHMIANALKFQFSKTAAYKRFTALVSHGAKCLRQTQRAFLMPPKLRSKGRFQSIGKLGKWGEKMREVFAVKGRAKEGSLLAKLRLAFPEFSRSRSFIKRFALTSKIVSDIMKTLKNKGLNENNYKQCYRLSCQLPRNSVVKKRLQSWLKKNLKVQKKLEKRYNLPSLSLLVSSDIIESLFGNFKHIIARSPQADMNRSVLLIPALCGTLDNDVITQAMRSATQNDLKEWEKEHIPYTVQKMRRDFFNQNNPNSGKIKPEF